jgi:hypothetical protein
MTDAERIATLEALLRKLWGTHVEPYLNDPEDGKKFIALDHELRELGLL